MTLFPEGGSLHQLLTHLRNEAEYASEAGSLLQVGTAGRELGDRIGIVFNHSPSVQEGGVDEGGRGMRAFLGQRSCELNRMVMR